VIKLRNGEYTSLNLHIDIDEMLAMRASIIRHTAEIFDPDLFIVDKEPLGLRGEVLETLQLLKSRGTPLVLGLRDVMDEPSALAPEWERKKVLPALDKLYDELWVYGLPQICDPLEGIKVPPSVRRKMVYTGYLERSASPNATLPEMPEDPFILVTPGGGGDGEDMVDWVLRAYESDPNLPHRALIVLGPFMNRDLQAEFMARASALPKVEALTFEAQLESLMSAASGVVAMGGYNTFCEILSFDRKALIVPRMVPRLEQFIRASRAQELGLVSMLPDDGVRDAHAMATALRHLVQQQAPSDVIIPGLLDGLENVNRLAERHLSEPRRPARRSMLRWRA
jgi:predicted glycosyltransferase